MNMKVPAQDSALRITMLMRCWEPFGMQKAYTTTRRENGTR